MSVRAPTILICDDEEALRGLIRVTLERDGYAILEACDGEQSLELARRSRPDLVVLDLTMPRRHGLEVLAEIRRDPNLASTAVIVVTARAGAADVEAVTAAGADHFLAKPFSPLKLAALAEGILGDRPGEGGISSR